MNSYINSNLIIRFRLLFYSLCFFQGLFLFSVAHAHQPKSGKIMGSIGALALRSDFNRGNYGAPNEFHGGFGIVAEGDANDHGGIEIGLFFFNKQYARTKSLNTQVEKKQEAYITMGYRNWLNDRTSVGLALFSSYIIGDYSIVQDNPDLPTALDTSARDVTDYGIDFSLQREFFAKEKTQFIIDLRYAYSLTEKSNESGGHYALFLALKYTIQEQGTKDQNIPTEKN